MKQTLRFTATISKNEDGVVAWEIRHLYVASLI